MLSVISADHIIAALEKLDQESWPQANNSRKFHLLHAGKHYPPKMVLSTAYKLATGNGLSHEAFSGGAQSNAFLRCKGFEIVDSSGTSVQAHGKAEKTSSIKKLSKHKAQILTESLSSDESDEWKKHFKIGRIVIKGSLNGNLDKVSAMLNQLAKDWPTGTTTDYLTTCGGLITLELGCADSFEKESESRFSDIADITHDMLKPFFKAPVKLFLKRVCRFFSVGVDVSIFFHGNGVERSMELVMCYDTRTFEPVVTAKSYPTMRQASRLDKCEELESHLQILNGEKVMILGCHDLNIFNPRTIKEVGRWRRKLVEKFAVLAKRFKPTVVLQHPHTNDTAGIWRLAWYNLKKMLPSVQEFAGSGSYYCGSEKPRGKIDACLGYTASADVLNIIIEHQKPYRVKFEQNQPLFKFKK